MRFTQLKDFWTGQLAPEEDRARIQNNIDRITKEAEQARSESERLACIYRIQILQGYHPPVRS